jgi:hypothetical protein
VEHREKRGKREGMIYLPDVGIPVFPLTFVVKAIHLQGEG